jgi:hypothetical protein
MVRVGVAEERLPWHQGGKRFQIVSQPDSEA